MTHGSGELVGFDAYGAAVVALAGPAAERRRFARPYEWDASEAEWLADESNDSDGAQIARLVIEHGVTGFLHAPDDLEGMAASGLEVLLNPARHRQVVEAARRRVTERFCADRVVPMYEECYKRA